MNIDHLTSEFEGRTDSKLITRFSVKCGKEAISVQPMDEIHTSRSRSLTTLWSTSMAGCFTGDSNVGSEMK